MKKTRLMFLLSAMALLGTTIANGQSKKEKIAVLSRRVDSLQRVLAAKNESAVQLQIKLARVEGATDAQNEEIKRLETRGDSLKDVLMIGKVTIDSQAAKIKQLTSDNAALQAQQKELTGKNDELNAQLTDLKPKPVAAAIAPKDAGPTNPPKQEPKSGGGVTPNKPDSLKNRPNK